MDAGSYLQQLQALLPTGAAWPREADAVLTRLLGGLAEEFARIDSRIEVLLIEADPDLTLELLGDWERYLGLPDTCTPAASTVRERQRAIVQKLSSLGGQTPAYFRELAALVGYVVEIEEFSQFRMGRRMGDRLFGEAWVHAFLVRVLSPNSDLAAASAAIQSSIFRMGSRMGERLRSFSVNSLECIFRRAAPAHATVVFAFEFDPEPVLWFDFQALQGVA